MTSFHQDKVQGRIPILFEVSVPLVRGAQLAMIYLLTDKCFFICSLIYDGVFERTACRVGGSLVVWMDRRYLQEGVGYDVT